MAVSENEEAALWLIQNVFNHAPVPFVIAGNGVSARLKNAAAQNKKVRLIDGPSMQQIDELIQQAHINVLPSMNNTGVKLKLLNALLNGRFCITNANGVKGSKIGSGLHIADNPAEWIQLIETIKCQGFSASQVEERQHILSLYNNGKNARKLNAIW